jgi:oligopeptide/dipeptide ABC transporter ATP-binding protein
MPIETPIVELRDVRKHYPVSRSPFARNAARVRAVDGVSFSVNAGETLSIVGESGCGKTTTARLILHLERPTDGRVLFRGTGLDALDAAGRRDFRLSVQAVFQDPWSSLNPRLKVGTIIAEPLVVNRSVSAAQARERVAALLTQVGLRPDQAKLYPHQFSGGQRQRIAIARALSVEPRLIVLDEPVSALDVSIRAQILNLLRDLQERFGLSYVMIAHHLATVRHMSHHVVVMYLGQVVEMAPGRELFDNPLHPYTRALHAAALSTRHRGAQPQGLIQGETPSPLHPPGGCRFHTRCPSARPECAEREPRLRELTPGHFVQDCACVTEAA